MENILEFRIPDMRKENHPGKLVFAYQGTCELDSVYSVSNGLLLVLTRYGSNIIVMDSINPKKPIDNNVAAAFNEFLSRERVAFINSLPPKTLEDMVRLGYAVAPLTVFPARVGQDKEVIIGSITF